jgi:glycosyltransferase involved in cell wall biosynthesis
MKIGVNARRLEGQRLGVGRYIEYLLAEWESLLEPEDDVTLYFRHPQEGSRSGLSSRFTNRHVGPSLTGMLWESTTLARGARDRDVLFGPSYTAPLIYGRPTVVAIHSLNEAETGTHAWWYRYTYGALYARCARGADKVIVPSVSTANDMKAEYDLAPEKIEVVPLGVDPVFKPAEDDASARAVRSKYLTSDRPYVLVVGKLSQRRNAPLLIEAFARAKKRLKFPHYLLFFGPNHLRLPLAQLAVQHGVSNDIVQTDGRLDWHSDLAAIYNGADLYLNASSYEGFCLPLLEALASGTPVVTSTRGALGEIAGDAAVTVEDPTVESIATEIARTLGDPALRAELSARGVERAGLFSWRTCATRTLAIIKDVGEQNR